MGTGYGMFSGCGCCAEGNVCDPKPGGRGSIGLVAWIFGPQASAPNINIWAEADAFWFGAIRIASTFTGKIYRFEWRKPQRRTYKLPSTPPDDWWLYWPNEVNYFSEATGVNFTNSELKIFIEPGGFGADTQVLPQDQNALALAEALGQNPFLARLEVEPLPSINSGPIQFPSDYSVFSEYPDNDVWDGRTDAVALAWAANHVLGGLYTGDQFPGSLPFWINWGQAFSADGFSVLLTEQYTKHPAGFRFRASGLGPLDEPIHQLGFADPIFFGGNIPAGPYYCGGRCYERRLNETFGPLRIDLRGGITVPAPPNATPAQLAQQRIEQSINGNYLCEFANSDPAYQWRGRGENWLLKLSVTPPAGTYDRRTQGQYECAPGGGGRPGYAGASYLTLEWSSLHSHFTFNWGWTHIRSFLRQSLTNDQMRNLPGVGTYPVGDDPNVVGFYLTDPHAFAIAIASRSQWSQQLWYQNAGRRFDDPQVSIAAA